MSAAETQDNKSMPEFVELLNTYEYSTDVQRLELDEVPCSKTTQAELNRGNAQLQFIYKGVNLYRPSSSKSGFHIRFRFRTRVGVNNNSGANITLASNFFGYLFDRVELKLGSTKVEEINFPGIVMDTFYHTEELEFRNYTGQRVGFIPDTSGVVSDTIGNRQGDYDGVDVAALIGSGNNVNNRIVRINNDYNEGFVRRKKLYNYTVAGNDNFREGELFIPLYHLFGYFSEVDKLLKYVNLEINLVRSANNTYCYYGAAGSTMQFPDDESGIISIQLLIQRVDLAPPLMIKIENWLQKPLSFPYLRRICEEHRQIGNQMTYNITKNFGSEEGIPRYVFCIFKTAANDTAETNYQRCPHANMQEITVKFAGNRYPSISQDSNFPLNQFSRFYEEFIDVARCLGNRNPGLSMDEYRDLFTIYAFDISAAPVVSITPTLNIDIKRRAIPAVGDATLVNPNQIHCYVIYVCQAVLEIHATKNTTNIIP